MPDQQPRRTEPEKVVPVGAEPDARDSAEILELVDLAPVGALVRTLGADVITYWSHGAEELYGWTAAEACGQVSHILLQTVFPVSQRDIENALKRDGRWSANSSI